MTDPNAVPLGDPAETNEADDGPAFSIPVAPPTPEPRPAPVVTGFVPPPVPVPADDESPAPRPRRLQRAALAVVALAVAVTGGFYVKSRGEGELARPKTKEVAQKPEEPRIPPTPGVEPAAPVEHAPSASAVAAPPAPVPARLPPTGGVAVPIVPVVELPNPVGELPRPVLPADLAVLPKVEPSPQGFTAAFTPTGMGATAADEPKLPPLPTPVDLPPVPPPDGDVRQAGGESPATDPNAPAMPVLPVLPSTTPPGGPTPSGGLPKMDLPPLPASTPPAAPPLPPPLPVEKKADPLPKPAGVPAPPLPNPVSEPIVLTPALPANPPAPSAPKDQTTPGELAFKSVTNLPPIQAEVKPLPAPASLAGFQEQTAPPPPAATLPPIKPVADIPPRPAPAATQTVPADPTVRRAEYEVNLVAVRPGDSYDAIAKESLGDAKFGPALRRYNGERDLRSGEVVKVPPTAVLRKLGEPSWVGPPGRAPAEGRTYVTPRDGMSMWDVAYEVYGTKAEFRKVIDANRDRNPNLRFRAGERFRLPAE